ncbi:hypothetical protein IVA94_14630 [Bradyrhizobium sp. 156]|uniref:hypothetical protein n=1 Tax=Bradyrhizobium sp. 156 TaxID=2782630 RepID=UPI001FF7C294|nr:hypothetical protein [Bradyrhizobium sp. 156]MCK1322104.1 hypothetical protein [Bradyrhizobium sp. 156]
MNLFWIWFWLMVGNVSYQFFGPLHWADAFERSCFQAIAILGVWFVGKMQSLAQSQHHRGTENG